MIEPTTTTYSLLGLLSLRSWTGYELTQQARRSLRFAWPRSEAHLYTEQKRLVRLGWAVVSKERVTVRTRNRYEITPAGKKALRAWLKTTPDAPQFEVEGLVRIFFADHGSPKDLANALRATGDSARAAIADMCGFVEDYFETGGPFPERLHVIAMAADLVTRLLSDIERFTDDAISEVEGWGSTKDLGMTDEAAARLKTILDRAPSDRRSTT